MAGSVLTKTRSLVVRGLAAVGVVAAFAVGGLGTTLGVSGLALTATTTSAQAQPWDGGWRRRGEFRRGWGWRRGYRRGWRGDDY